MKKEMFNPYKEFLLRTIASVETKDQVLVCHNMIDNFMNCFRGVIPIFEMNDAQIELMDALQLKVNTDTII